MLSRDKPKPGSSRSSLLTSFAEASNPPFPAVQPPRVSIGAAAALFRLCEPFCSPRQANRQVELVEINVMSRMQLRHLSTEYTHTYEDAIMGNTTSILPPEAQTSAQVQSSKRLRSNRSSLASRLAHAPPSPLFPSPTGNNSLLGLARFARHPVMAPRGASSQNTWQNAISTSSRCLLFPFCRPPPPVSLAGRAQQLSKVLLHA